MSGGSIERLPQMPPTSAAGGLRAELLTGIQRHRAAFAAAGDEAESLRTLPPDAVATLRSLGLFWLKTPASLGGTPLPPLEFCDVIEELAYTDVSTAWAAMIGAGCCGLVGGWLPEAGARRVFTPRLGAGVGAGGRRRGGRRGFGLARGGGAARAARHRQASLRRLRGHRAMGVLQRHPARGLAARRVQDGLGGGRRGGSDGGTGFGRMVVFAAPKSDAEVIDNWYVAGLQGTGSLDFRVEGLFVPEEMTYDLGIPAVRGGDLFRLGMPAFVSNEVPPLCVGLARRALDDMTELALHTARFPGGPTVSDRAVFHKELGRAETKLRAARLVHREAMADCWEMACAGDPPSEEQQLAVTAASVFAVETAAEVVSDLFRYGGGRVLALSNPMQRHLRNALAARQHLALSEEGYEAAGRYRLESAKSRHS